VKRLRDREAELADFACPAGELYTGMQHLRLMEGVRIMRDALGESAVDVSILSAGYGLVSEKQLIAPYEVTFNGMKAHEVDSWAKRLSVHDHLESIVKDYELIFFLLGDNYLRAVSLPIATNPHQALIFLASRSKASSIQSLSAKTFILPLSNPEAKKYRYGLVGLKGFLFKKLSEAIATQPLLIKEILEEPNLTRLILEKNLTEQENQLEITEVLEQIPDAPKKIKISNKKSKSKSSNQLTGLLEIPDGPPAPNRHLGTQYFIPEWDDRVYPHYDFVADELPENRDPYHDDVYAHEIYQTPNYDGILISKILIDESATRRERIEQVGVHKFVRFPGEIMGDCGAFGYVKEDEPPYETEEILDYYERLGFNYGVSIDHLIFGPFAEPGIREKRYELTLRNAEEFLKQHRIRGYKFTPIGVAQGWSPESYAESVQALTQMGYDFIAIGGLARAQNREIIPVLKAIHPHVQSHVRIHLFGVARIEAIPIFQHLGVTSFDSAGPLRQAWLSSSKNYHTLTGRHYMAIRVPQTDGQRAKKALETGGTNLETLERLERNALTALRDFDQGKLDLETTLEVVAAYNDALDVPKQNETSEKLAKAQSRRREKYREILMNTPWKDCDCPICLDSGIEVAIFRKNNRNRRRGFHNTYVFYKRLQNLLI
jgi:queuine/archaeosine tRNA-ribosyltransferase